MPSRVSTGTLGPPLCSKGGRQPGLRAGLDGVWLVQQVSEASVKDVERARRVPDLPWGGQEQAPISPFGDLKMVPLYGSSQTH